MKIKKILLTLILSVLWCGVLFAQNIVKDTNNVRKPIVGKLYYQKTDNNLYLFRNGFELVDLYAENIVVPPDTSIANPPIGEKEYIIGFWDVPNRILVSKLINGKYYLMQRGNLSSYHVARGKDLLSDSRTQVTASEAILKAIVSENSGLGGLEKPNNFPESDFLAMGYYKNSNGEYVPNGSTLPIPITDKIKIPVGVIMWDNWQRDYWNDANPKYDYLINHISINRLAVTEWQHKFNLLPFYGQYHSPEKIKIRYNVRWSQADGRNLYDEREAMVEAKFDKTSSDTEREVRYYKNAGIDWLCFNYYADDSYLSETRREFVDMPDKMGMKMTFLAASNRSDKEIDYITTLMTKDYWFRIDNKPVLYLESHHFPDLPKYRASLSAKGINDIYVVYFSMGGYPGDWQDIQSKRCNAVGAYSTFPEWQSAEELISQEVAGRETWMGQFKNTNVSIIPVITNGFENLHKRTSLATEKTRYTEGATMEQIDRKTKLVGEFVKKYPTKVPAILWYAGNELLECGEMSLVPKKLKNGTIDTSVLDTISKHLE